MDRLTREMTFEEEYTFLKKEVKELFDKEDRESEPPESHCVVRRALRCIKKFVAELEPYKEYKDLEEQGFLLRLPCKVGDTIYELYRDGEYCVSWWDIKEVGFSLSYYERYKDKFGKSVFLTKEEAEQKLKEMESD